MGLLHSPLLNTDGLIFNVNASTLKSYPGIGGLWYDISGNGNVLSLLNVPVAAFNVARDYITTSKGRAIQFYDVSSNNETYAVGSKTLSLTFPCSIMYWCKPISSASAVYKGIFRSHSTGEGPHGIHLVVKNDNTVQAGFGRNVFSGNFDDATYGNFATTSTTLTPSQWYHLAAVIRGKDNMDVYINGIKQSVSYTGAGTTIGNPASTYPGFGRVYQGSNYRYCTFQADDARIYNRALSEKEIVQAFSTTRLKLGV